MVRVAISNFGRPGDPVEGRDAFWHECPKPERPQRLSLFEYRVDWGFHLYGLGVRMMDLGIADEVEFWDFTYPDAPPARQRGMSYHYMGVLRVNFQDVEDVYAYIRRHGPPDLLVNHGRRGEPIVQYLKDRCFRVHVPAFRFGPADAARNGAECYLVDSERYLVERSMLYLPVVNTRRIFPNDAAKQRDFVCLAWPRQEKRHDIIIEAVRNRGLTGHFHPVPPHVFDLAGTGITTSEENEIDLVELLRTSRIAVYPGDRTYNPAAMWECVAAGLPIVMNAAIGGGEHLVVSGVTGELAHEGEFLEVMGHVLENLESYRPREYFEENWATEKILDGYIEFFRRHGWQY